MLTIKEFSKICQVSTKTLRYYDEIDLLKPILVKDNGYRYYSSNQLDSMLMINKLKKYQFSLDEIKRLLNIEHEEFIKQLNTKKIMIEKEIIYKQNILNELYFDIHNMNQGNEFMSYFNDIQVEFIEKEDMYLVSIRKNVQKDEFEKEYGICYGVLLRKIADEKLTMIGPPMILYHDNEFRLDGLDCEFAIPVLEKQSRILKVGDCLKTTLIGSYSQLSAVYAKHMKVVDDHGYEITNALFEVYVNDPSCVKENELVTEVYTPVRKL